VQWEELPHLKEERSSGRQKRVGKKRVYFVFSSIVDQKDEGKKTQKESEGKVDSTVKQNSPSTVKPNKTSICCATKM
jgi:hypothetical protein